MCICVHMLTYHSKHVEVRGPLLEIFSFSHLVLRNIIKGVRPGSRDLSAIPPVVTVVLMAFICICLLYMAYAPLLKMAWGC